MSNATRHHFLTWQCRVRQMSVRKHAGMPLPGMMPKVDRMNGEALTDAITVLILHEELDEVIDTFRHIVKRTHDPQKRREDAVKILSNVHYQYPDQFSEKLTALFGEGSSIAGALMELGECRLEFSQFGQTYMLPCKVEELTIDDDTWQATFWHNHMFNPKLSDKSHVLTFLPDWGAVTLDPPLESS